MKINNIFLKFIFLGVLSIIAIFYLVPLKNLSKEFSDFATPDELILKTQVFAMPWQKLNGPFGGQGYTIRFSPDNSNKIIVTDSFAGIHVSSDRGLTWTESNQGIDARFGKSGDAVPVFVTTIDPNNPLRVWCGVKNLMGVFLSTDGGMTWQHKDNGLPSGNEVEIRGLAVKPGDSNTIFAAGDLEEIGPLMGQFQRTQGIVYRTTDGGENWTPILMGGNLFKDIIIDPNNANTVYVASGFFDRQQLEKLEGIYKSTDSGNSWTQINAGIRNLYVPTLKFDPTNPNIIWGTTGMINQFGTDSENEDGSIIVSRDGGMTWAEAKRGRNNGQTQIYSALGISPTNTNIIYSSGFGLFTKSTDGGMTWTETGFGPLGSNAGHPIDIVVDPNDENTVFIDSYIGGVFKSADGGKTWTSNTFGYSGAESMGVAISPNNQTIFATSRSGVFLSQDKGVNWLPVGLGDIGQDELWAIAPHPTDNNKILLGDGNNSKSSIFLSSDGGMSWKSVFMVHDFFPVAAATDLTGTVVFTDIKWAQSNPNIAYASCVKQSLSHDFVDSIGWGIFKSIDGGMTWINKQNGIPGFKNTWSIEIDPNNENIIYAATNDAGLIKSIDGGENWTQISNGLQGVKSFHSVSICPANTQVVLAGSEDGRIFRSADGGNTWISALNDVRPQDNITSIVFNPVNAPQVFASGNVTGCYVSNDAGNTWQQFNDGLSIREIEELTITPDGSAVYVATNGGGVFRLPITGNSLTLSRTQTETPSNAGIDAVNNAGFSIADINSNNSSGAPVFNSTSSSGSATSSSGSVSSSMSNEFSLTASGPILSGLKLFKNKTSKSSLIISKGDLVQNKKIKVTLSTILPKQAIRISPAIFVLDKNNVQTVNITVPAFKKLSKIKKIQELFPDELPVSIKLTIVQTIDDKSISKDIEIPLIITEL